MPKYKAKQDKENTQSQTKRQKDVVEKAVTENTGLLGRAARTLGSRKADIEKRLKDSGA